MVGKLLTVSFALVASTSFAQIFTLNDGFEGHRRQDLTPYPWSNSTDGFSSADTQPGQFNNNKEPSEGNSYVSLVTRALSQPGTVETIWCELMQPFYLGKCYELLVDLSLSDEFKASWAFEDVFFDNPCRLNLIGFNGDIASPLQEEVLWESDIISNFEWKSYEISFTPTLGTFQKIALRPDFINDTSIVNSVIFIDNLRLKKEENSLINDLGLITIPEGSSNIDWIFNGAKVELDNPFLMPGLGTGHYVVSFFNSQNCFRKLSEVLEFSEDKLEVFPNPGSDYFTLLYYSSKNQTNTIRIYNELGQLVGDYLFNSTNGYSSFTMDVSNLAEASYFIQLIKPDGKTLYKKVIVLR